MENGVDKRYIKNVFVTFFGITFRGASRNFHSGDPKFSCFQILYLFGNYFKWHILASTEVKRRETANFFK